MAMDRSTRTEARPEASPSARGLLTLVGSLALGVVIAHLSMPGIFRALPTDLARSKTILDALQHPPEMVTYLGTRNIAIFSCDLDSFDFKAKNAQQVIDVTMKKLDKLGKGIILMHDFHKHTAEALPTLLRRLKEGGYKVVWMKAKAPVQTLPQYDEELQKDVKLPTVSSRPVSSSIRTRCRVRC